MIREKVILGNYTYIIDYFDASTDLKNDLHHYEKFYLLKNQDFISGILVDKDILFIPQSNTNNLCFPLPNGTSLGYSTNPNEFSDKLTDNTIEKNKYKLYNSDQKEIELLCDKIRIYIPTIYNKLNAIIDIENYINDIKFHYLVDLTNNYSRLSNTELVINNITYSEYIEIYIPSLKSLLYSNNIYIKDYNQCINKNTQEIFNLKDQNDNYTSLVPFKLLYYPYIIESDINSETGSVSYKKVYDNKINFINNQFYSTLNIILTPYLEVDTNNMYVQDINNLSNSDTFNLNISFSLKSKIRFLKEEEFDSQTSYNKYYGLPFIVNDFDYPDSDTKTLQESYLYFNGSTERDYQNYENNKDNDNDLFIEELESINKTGFYIEFSTNKYFKEVFYKLCINLNDSIIDTLMLPLNDIFDSWNDIPEIILYRVSFVDKVNCNIITSNPVILSKEWYKYLINDLSIHKLKFNKITKFNRNTNMLVSEINKNDLVFIDKINCSIIKSSENDNNINIKKSNTPKVIYKPIFYKTSELQSINLRAGFTQNVGIDLSEYLSKVETFKLLIEQNEYIETGRNDIYVIFSINAKEINNTSGRYNIVNENDDYISDGIYTIN